MQRRAVASTAVGGSLLAAMLGLGWAGTVLVVAVVLVVTIAVCWVLADEQRPARLALVLTAWRRAGTDRSLEAAPDRPGPGQ